MCSHAFGRAGSSFLLHAGNSYSPSKGLLNPHVSQLHKTNQHRPHRQERREDQLDQSQVLDSLHSWLVCKGIRSLPRVAGSTAVRCEHAPGQCVVGMYLVAVSGTWATRAGAMKSYLMSLTSKDTKISRASLHRDPSPQRRDVAIPGEKTTQLSALPSRHGNWHHYGCFQGMFASYQLLIFFHIPSLH